MFTRLPSTPIPSVADSFNNIGAVYAGEGDLENALVQFQKALEIRTRVFGSEHHVAVSYQNLAAVHRVRETTYRQKRWQLRHTIYSLRSYDLIIHTHKRVVNEVLVPSNEGT